MAGGSIMAFADFGFKSWPDEDRKRLYELYKNTRMSNDAKYEQAFQNRKAREEAESAARASEEADRPAIARRDAEMTASVVAASHQPSQVSITSDDSLLTHSDHDILQKWSARKEPASQAKSKNAPPRNAPKGPKAGRKPSVAQQKPLESLEKIDRPSHGQNQTGSPLASTVTEPSNEINTSDGYQLSLTDPSSSHDKSRKRIAGNDMMSSLPKIAKRSSTCKPKLEQPNSTAGPSNPAMIPTRQSPQWYQTMKKPAKIGSQQTNADILLARLKTSITRCKASPKDQKVTICEFSLVRSNLHNLAFENVDAGLSRFKRILHNEDGLPQIFDSAFAGNVEWPWDIKADAEELYNKWCAQMFDVDLLHGIIVPTKGSDDKKANDYKLADKRSEPLLKANSFGSGKLLNGQWWPRQLCLVRDGAHGATQAGICGKPGEGAYSIIVSGGHDYPDVDEGETLLYCGTDSNNGVVTDKTQAMLDSVGKPNAVRVIRSSNGKSRFAPQIGFRYDGLYLVVNSERMNMDRPKMQRHRFKLVRVSGQDAIRGGFGPEARPTQQEIRAYNEDKRLRGC